VLPLVRLLLVRFLLLKFEVLFAWICLEYFSIRALPLQFEVLSAEPRWRSAVTDAVEDEVGSTPGPIIPCYAHTGAEETLLDVIKKYDVAPKKRVYQKQRWVNVLPGYCKKLTRKDCGNLPL
jgi:hypothetical protein